MFKFENATSPRLIYEVFNQMLGPDEARKFWKEYRDNYIIYEDIKLTVANIIANEFSQSSF